MFFNVGSGEADTGHNNETVSILTDQHEPKRIEIDESDELVNEATLRWTKEKKRTKLPGQVGNTFSRKNIVSVKESANASVQTDDYNVDIELHSELARKEQRAVQLLKTAAKVLGLDDFEDDDMDEDDNAYDDDDQDEEMWKDIDWVECLDDEKTTKPCSTFYCFYYYIYKQLYCQVVYSLLISITIHKASRNTYTK